MLDSRSSTESRSATGLFHQIIEHITATVVSDANLGRLAGLRLLHRRHVPAGGLATMLFWWLDSRKPDSVGSVAASAAQSIA